MSRLTPLALTVARAKRQAGACTTAAGNPLGGAHPVAAVAAPTAFHDPRDADRAMAALAPFVRETAQRIHGRYYALRRQSAADFVSQSPALIWSRIDHFADWYYQELPQDVRAEDAKDYFAAWCYRELNYRYLDYGRAQKNEPKVKAIEAGGDLADTRSAPTEPSVYDFALTESDAVALGDWDPLDGVILFCLAGQAEQVPAKLWGRWLDELGLEPPFPPEAFVSAPRPRRRAVLADALGVSRDVIFQRWHRLKKKYLEA